MNLYDLTVPQLIRVLGQIHRWLDKAQAYAEQKNFNPMVLLSARLAPDQWDLGGQLQVIALGPRRLSALLKGLEPPKPEEGEVTVASIRARLDASIEHLKALSPEEFQGVEDRTIPLPFMPGKGMKGSDFVTQFAIPNFYFHVITAYSILRHNGVDVGKMDFLGELSTRDL